MITHVMAVFDAKARAFIPPFFCSHVDIARRAFGDCANNPQHNLGKNPEDYTLYHLGTFNDETGEFDLLNQRVNLGTALNYKNREHTNVQE